MIDGDKGIEIDFDSKEPFNKAAEDNQEEVVPIEIPLEHAPVPQYNMHLTEDWAGKDEVDRAAFNNNQEAIRNQPNIAPLDNDMQEGITPTSNNYDALNVTPEAQAIEEQAIEDAKLEKANEERLRVESLSPDEYEAEMQKIAALSQERYIDEQNNLGPNNQNARENGNGEGFGD